MVARVANDDVGSAAATAGEGDGDLGIATHAATTTRTASTPSIAMARTFIVASFERGRAATTRIRGLEHPRDASTAARVSTTTRSAASRHAERCPTHGIQAARRAGVQSVAVNDERPPAPPPPPPAEPIPTGHWPQPRETNSQKLIAALVVGGLAVFFLLSAGGCVAAMLLYG